jgi:hypothetical protein
VSQAIRKARDFTADFGLGSATVSVAFVGVSPTNGYSFIENALSRKR